MLVHREQCCDGFGLSRLPTLCLRTGFHCRIRCPTRTSRLCMSFFAVSIRRTHETFTAELCITGIGAPHRLPPPLGEPLLLPDEHWQVHYVKFEPGLLVSAGNDQRLLLWDHHSYNEQHFCSTTNEGSLHDDIPLTGGFGGRHNLPPERCNLESTRRARRKNDGSKSGKSREVASETRKIGGAKIGSYQRAAPNIAEYATRKDRGCARDVWTCSVSVSELRLAEKPNWVTSTCLPHEVLLLADTSSEVKVLRRRG